MAQMTTPGIGNIATATSDFSSSNPLGNAGMGVPLERRCDNPDCNIYKMVSNVPQRSTPQFVTEPVVMEKPQLVSGFTTIFQIEGKSAKLSDIKNPDAQKPLYRIVPNTHAHIVNYVVVDPDTESLRKINENDPATMRKLLESQKQSADQMLKKLIAGHGIPVANINTINSNVPTSNATTATSTNAGTITPIDVSKLMAPQTSNTNKGAAATNNPTLHLPTSIHPNLKITSVASAEGTMIAGNSVASLLAQANAKKAQQQQQTSGLPLITPVPLANLQRASISGTQSPISTPPPTLSMLSTRSSDINLPSSSTANVMGDIIDTPNFDKMQQELKELRRTVALLAEAQAKNK